MSAQLAEMKSGGEDTKALANAAGTQAQAAVIQSQQTEVLATTASVQAKAALDSAEASRTLAEQAKVQTQKMVQSLSKTDELIRTATAQAMATNKLADASGSQAVSAEKALRLAAEADRPWMGFEGVDAPPPGIAGGVVVTTINSGRSPARIIEYVAAGLYTNVLPKDPPYDPSVIDPSKLSQTILVPGRPLMIRWDQPAREQRVIDAVTNGYLRLYFYSRVTYQDIRTGEIHQTKWCELWNPIGKNYVSGG